MSFQTMRLAIAAVGVAVWVYGYRVDDDRIRWVGIAVLAVAVFLRFFAPRKSTDTTRE
jgi:hypothetical protein